MTTQETISTAPWEYQKEYDEVCRRLQAIPADERDGLEAYKLYMRLLVFAPPAVLSEIAEGVRGTAWENFVDYLRTGLELTPAHTGEDTTDGIKDWLAEDAPVDESVTLQEVGEAVQELLACLYDADSLDPVRDKILALHQRLYPGKWITPADNECAAVTSDDAIPHPTPAAVLDWLLFEIGANKHNPEIVEQQASDARRMLRDIAELYNLPM